MGWVMRLLRRVLVYGTGVAVLLIGAIAAAYFVGIKLPVYAATTPVAFQNWNQTRTVKANLLHDSLVWRADGRTHLTVNLQMPKAVKRLKAFLDGGRTELVACGPQKLYLHSLLNGKLTIDGDVVRITGTVDMELDGPIRARDGWPLDVRIRVGNDRTSVWAQIISLRIGQIPTGMIDALLDQKSRFTYTRTQIIDAIAKDLSAEDAAFLHAHKGALDLAFESVKPAKNGSTLYLDAVISVDEGAAIDAIGDRLVLGPGPGAALAEVLGPSRAQAQLNLDGLTRELDKVGRSLQKDLGVDAETLAKDPVGALNSILDQLTDCTVAF